MTVAVGRDAELRRIDALLDAAARGDVRALSIEGEAGIGKTTLLGQAIQRGRERGARVLESRPTEREAALPFAGLIDLLEPVFDDALRVLPGPQREALGVALLQRPAVSPTDDLARGLAVRTALAEAAREAPLVLAVDDDQWLDPPTARTLEFALRRVEAPVAVIVARRAGGTGLALADVLPPGRVDQLTLRPLAGDELRRAVAAAGFRLPAPDLARIERWSGGNPYFAIELARHLQDEPDRRRGLAPPVPRSLQELLRGQLEAVPATVRRTLLTLAAASELPLDALDRAAVAEAGDRRLVDVEAGRVRFRHPLLRALVYESADPATRRDVHRQLANRLRSPDERALHLALATTAPDASTAEELAAAGERATLRGAPDSAAWLLEEAVAVTPPDAAELAERRVRLAELHFIAGDLGRSRALAEKLVAELPRGELRARALLLLGRLRNDDFAEMRRLLTAASAEADGLALRIGALTELAAAALNSVGLREARRYAHEALAFAQKTASPGDLARSLGFALFCDSFTGHPVSESELEHVLSLERAAPEIASEPPSATVGALHLYAGRVERARATLERTYDNAVRNGDEPARAVASLYLGFVEYVAGDAVRAREYAELTDELARQLEDPQGVAYASFLRAYVLGVRGELEASRSSIDDAAARASEAGDKVMLVGARNLYGFLALSEGDDERAAEAFTSAIALMREIGWREPGVHPTYQGAAEALVGLGRLDEAEAYVDELEELARPLDRTAALAGAARCRGLLAAAHGRFTDAIALFEEALELHARAPQPLETGRTLFWLGSILRRSQQKARGRAVLEEARATFEGIGAALWVARAENELSRIGGRAQAPRGLTPTEERIARLVATGKSNHEVAAALFVSPKTVEWNLSKVYKKLRVSSRAELAARFAKRPA